ncbi:MAG TPA: sodium-dependent transporter [Gammaproteobacteria bacterium]|jgi:NSS family neurotransmitter:Na+ symporter|nr:sodium-dependent transporter [Gammaproteobacteria bacterium]
MKDLQPRAQWRSFHSYVLVTTGAIIGLGNVFQFPLLVAKYGGLFLLFYILCELFISLPLLFAELLVGRRGKHNPVDSINILAMEADASRKWGKLGWLCVFIVTATLCYYVVSAAFPVGYFLDSLKELSVHGNQTVTVTLDTDLQQNFLKLEFCFLFFLFLAMFVVYRGINRGLEQISAITVPAYFLIFLILAIYINVSGNNFMDSIHEMIAIHPSQTILTVFVAALTFAFFKFGVGMGTMIVYGSYLPYSVSLARSTLVVVAIDALVSLLCYFIVNPLILTLPVDTFLKEVTNRNIIHVFTNIPHGILIASVFFFGAILAAWTPIIAMLETAVITLVERLNITRAAAVVFISSIIFLVGSLQVYAIVYWADIIAWHGISINYFLRDFTGNILEPISALFLVLFVGYVVKRQVSFNELQFSPPVFKLWRFLVRYVALISIVVILVTVTILDTWIF